jgi:ribose transport system permease protein
MATNTVVPILIICFLGASIFVDTFFSMSNVLNLLNQNAMKGIMAIGMTFVIINGYFDMSIVTLMSLTAALSSGLQPSLGTGLAIVVALLVGTAVGAINGFLVTKARINAFVATLAMMLGCRGASYIYSGEKTIIPKSEGFLAFGSGTVLGVSYISILFILLLFVAHFVLRYTKHGRNTYAVGGNARSAFNAGIDCDKTTFINFVICGFTGGLGGVLYAAFLGAASPSVGWPDLHMMVIAAVVVGGCSLLGGIGNVWYSLGGVIILGMISNVLNLLNVQAYISTLCTGLIIIVVLYVDRVMHMNRKRKKT